MKITIFGLEGTGKSSSAKLLADHLGYEYKSSGAMMREMANSEGITLEEFNTNRLNKVKEEGDDGADREIDEYIRKYGEVNDNFVFESRLAWSLIPDSFRVKLVCSDEVRARRVAVRDGISEGEAIENNIRRQKENKEIFETIYNIKNYPPEDEEFDLVVDTGENSLEEVVGLVVGEINIIHKEK